MQRKFRTLVSVAAIAISALSMTVVGCSDKSPAPAAQSSNDVDITAFTTNCGCTYTVPGNTNGQFVDGSKLGIKAGDVICLQAGTAYGNITFTNLVGTASQPITIKSCGEGVTMKCTGRPYGLKTIASSFLHIAGGAGTTRNFTIDGGENGISIEGLSTDVEIDHLEVKNTHFAGIMAKTDPTCDPATNRGNFVMKNVVLHDNFVHDTGGEGFYIGNSFFNDGESLSCGLRYPHEVVGVKIYNNMVKHSGWESIQVGSAPQGAMIYNNHIEDYGQGNVAQQNNGIQFGEGSNGRCYGNWIKNGNGDGIIIIGNSDNYVYDNVIIGAGMDGIFCDDRVDGNGFHFINNTIINPAQNGIKLYADQVNMNYVQNNIIINPGNYATFGSPRPKTDAFVYLLNKSVKVTMNNNWFSEDITTAGFVNPSADDYSLKSPAANTIDKGVDVSGYGITTDFAGKPRSVGTATDLGAFEIQ